MPILQGQQYHIGLIELVWIGEPSHPFDKKYKRWPQWVTWDFKMQDGDKSWTGLMGEEEHEVYLAEVEILKQLKHLTFKPEMRRALLDAIEKYGDKREEKGRNDVNEDWAERDAGASV